MLPGPLDGEGFVKEGGQAKERSETIDARVSKSLDKALQFIAERIEIEIPGCLLAGLVVNHTVDGQSGFGIILNPRLTAKGRLIALSKIEHAAHAWTEEEQRQQKGGHHG
jgi:hypothetical protein